MDKYFKSQHQNKRLLGGQGLGIALDCTCSRATSSLPPLALASAQAGLHHTPWGTRQHALM